MFVDVVKDTTTQLNIPNGNLRGKAIDIKEKALNVCSGFILEKVIDFTLDESDTPDNMVGIWDLETGENYYVGVRPEDNPAESDRLPIEYISTAGEGVFLLSSIIHSLQGAFAETQINILDVTCNKCTDESIRSARRIYRETQAQNRIKRKEPSGGKRTKKTNKRSHRKNKRRKTRKSKHTK